MNPLIETKIRQFTLEFIDLWNQGNLDSLSPYMKPDIRLTSPLLGLVYPEHSGNELKGREEVIQYWKKLQRIRPNMILDLKDFQRKEHDILLVAAMRHEPMEVQVSFRYTQYGKIEELHFQYIPV